MEQWIIVGLGNPGPEYAATRHNQGFRVLDEIARRWRMGIDRRQFGGWIGQGVFEQHLVTLLKPTTFMNLSGRSVGAAYGHLHGIPERLLIVHDDIDLPPGRIRVKQGGGHGGHNGLRSIMAELGHGDFLRIRIGVGRPNEGDAVDHVLGEFTQDELAQLPEIIGRSADAVEELLRHGLSAAMNRFNVARILPKTESPPESVAATASSPIPQERGCDPRRSG